MDGQQLIRGVFECAKNYGEDRYTRKTMLREMLDLVCQHCQFDSTEAAILRKAALEVTNLVDPDAVESEA